MVKTLALPEDPACIGHQNTATIQPGSTSGDLSFLKDVNQDVKAA